MLTILVGGEHIFHDGFSGIWSSQVPTQPGVVTVVRHGVPAEGVLPQPLASNKICWQRTS